MRKKAAAINWAVIGLNACLLMLIIVAWFPEIRPASYTASEIRLLLYITLIGRLVASVVRDCARRATCSQTPKITREINVDAQALVATMKPHIVSALLEARKASKP